MGRVPTRVPIGWKGGLPALDFHRRLYPDAAHADAALSAATCAKPANFTGRRGHTLMLVIGRIGVAVMGEGRPAPARKRRTASWPAMPIRALLQGDHAFSPEEIANLTAAFEDALGRLGLVHRDDPATLTVAKLIIELAKAGERDPARLRDGVLKILRK